MRFQAHAYGVGKINRADQRKLELEAVSEYRRRIAPIVADIRGSPICNRWVEGLVEGT